MYKTLIVVAAAALAVQGCAPQSTAPTMTAEETNEGRAATCTASAVDLAAATPATIAMTDDGWCGPSVTEADGKAFALGLVTTRPVHGHVLIHTVSGRTRVEYTPDGRYVGPDAFTVALRPRGQGTPDAKVQFAVTVTAGANVVAAPEPARQTTPARPSTKPARRSRN